MRTPALALIAALALAGCVSTPVLQVPQAPPGADPEVAARAQLAVRNFLQVVEDVEPVAERECRRQAPDLNCDFRIVVERDPRAGVNAFQTEDEAGRPLVIFTLGLIAVARNTDELAFIMGHETGHHIARHLMLQRVRAEAGARLFEELARARGANANTIGRAGQLGSFVGARSFSQQAELEADAVGTVISFEAGYDPVRGAEFFTRIPEPGMAFLSSHPPNSERIEIVRQTAARLR